MAGIVTVALAVWGCDAITGPDGSTAFYQLRLVGGSPVPGPVPSSFGFVAVDGGGLVFRPNGTFAMTADYLLPVLLEGTVSYDGSLGESRPFSITFPTSDTSTYSLSGTVKGDTLVLKTLVGTGFGVDTVPLTFVRSSAPPVTVTDGIYVLTDVVGAPKTPGGGVVRSDTTISGTRYVSRVLYDTIQFVDGVFIRRARSSVDSAIYPNGTSNYSSEGYIRPGMYGGTSGYLLVKLFGFTGTTRDSLDVGAGTLMRSSRFTRTEVYTRQ